MAPSTYTISVLPPFVLASDLRSVMVRTPFPESNDLVKTRNKKPNVERLTGLSNEDDPPVGQYMLRATVSTKVVQCYLNNLGQRHYNLVHVLGYPIFLAFRIGCLRVESEDELVNLATASDETKHLADFVWLEGVNFFLAIHWSVRLSLAERGTYCRGETSIWVVENFVSQTS